MGELKGFYFSLDAMIASMVLLATATMLLGYTQSVSDTSEPVSLDKLHAASLQKASDWNSSYEGQKTVLEQIYLEYYSSPSDAENICDQYFNISEYALYFSNSTTRQKVCGDYTIGDEDSVSVEETIIPDIPVNSEFKGPQKAVLVVQN